MVSKKKSEWPPRGWKVEIKVSFNGRRYKCYINSKTGEKLNSKLAVLRCIRKGKRGNRESQSHGTKQHPKTKPENKKMHLVEANGSLNLPPGWTLEWKIRQSGAAKGTKYKCITDPSTGSKFYSMPEVYRYLKSRKVGAGSSKQAKGESILNLENNSSVNPMSPQKSNLKKEMPEDSEPTIHDKLSSEKMKSSVDPMSPEESNLKKGTEDSKLAVQTKLYSGKMNVVVERISDEDLPSGWVKEIRIRKNRNNIRRDPFYIETVTGLVFRSKLDVLRYLETGEISRHAYRRKINNVDESESPEGKAPPTRSSNIEKTSKGSKRKHFKDEGSPEQSILVPLVAAGNNEAQSKRITRSSSKVQSVSTGLEQIHLLSGPTKTVHEVVPAKPNGEVSAVRAQSKRVTRLSSKFQSADICEPSLEQIPLLPEPAQGAQKIVPPKHNGEVPSIGAQSKRRTRSTSKVPSADVCEPNLEQILLLSEPAQGAQGIVPAKPNGEVSSVATLSKRRTRSSSQFQPASTCGPSLEQVPSLTKPSKRGQEIVPAKTDGEVSSVGAQSTRRRKSSAKVQPAYTYEPNLEQIMSLPEPIKGAQEKLPAKHNGTVFAVEAIGDVKPEVHVANGKQNNAVPIETEFSTFSKHKSDVTLQGSSVRRTRVDRSPNKDSKVSNLSSHSSERLAEVEPEVLSHSIPVEHAHLSIENSGKTDAIRLDMVPNESHQRAQAFDDDQQNVLTSQQETSWAFDVNTPTMLQTQNDSVENIDYIPQEYIEEIFFQDEGPPGFSQYPRSKITQSTIDQLFEDSVDTMPDDMIEKSPEEHITREEQQDTLSRTKIGKSSGNCPVREEPTTLEKNNEQPGSQFCFPSPLWSDPCLEFAFKTLTGALPLDDNVAIQDYMEHQLRTCDQVNNQQNPNTGISSFCQNDQTKLTAPSPGDVGFTKPNGFNTHKPNR